MRLIEKQWEQDVGLLPLSSKHKFLYTRLHERSFQLLKDIPNIAQPVTYNDKINWCKLFDQQEQSVQAVDKIGAVQYLAERGLEQYNRTILTHADSVEELELDKCSGECVIKNNHDSGSTRFLNFNKHIDFSPHIRYYNERLKKEYGLRNAEWQYSMIKPQVLIEQRLSNDIPADYKFHCCNGQVVWCQYIYDRFNGTKEINVLPDGTDTGILFDTNFKKGNTFTIPSTWDEMLELASTLSKPYKYVRVDLFSVDDKVYFGELTFFPRGGCYTGKGQEQLGKLLEIDTTTYKEPVWSQEKIHARFH